MSIKFSKFSIKLIKEDVICYGWLSRIQHNHAYRVDSPSAKLDLIFNKGRRSKIMGVIRLHSEDYCDEEFCPLWASSLSLELVRRSK